MSERGACWALRVLTPPTAATCCGVPAGAGVQGQTPPGTAERLRAPSGASLECWVIEAHRCNAVVPASSAQDSGNYVSKSTFQVYIFQLKFWRRSAVAMGPPGAVPGRFWVRGERGAGDVRRGPGRGVSMPRASGGEAKVATGVKRGGRMKRAGPLNN